MSLLALLLAAGPQALPAMQIQQVPGKGYSVTVDPFPTELAEAVQARMTEQATQRCGKLVLRWGRFSYDTKMGTGAESTRQYAVNYKQAFGCIDPATDPYKPAPADWKATAQDNAEALAFLKRYLATFDAADAKAGIAMMEPILEIDAPTWLRQPLAVKGQLGTGSRSFRGPQWQINPDTAAHPGAYAAFAFNSNFSGMAAHCGYLVLYRDRPGVYHVSQQSIQVFTRAAVAAGAATAAGAAKACEGY